jgi:Protein of unknown function (DUF2735)
MRAGQRSMLMKSSLSYGSAKIYQFPVGGRAALLGRRYGETASSIDQTTPRVNETICSGSWYHEAAIQESKLGSEPGSKPGWDH